MKPKRLENFKSWLFDFRIKNQPKNLTVKQKKLQRWELLKEIGV